MEPIVQRLKSFLEYKELSTSAFSRQLRYRSCEKIARLFRKGGALPSARILEDIARYCPELDIRWLLTGSTRSSTSVFLMMPPAQVRIGDQISMSQGSSVLPASEVEQ